MKQAQSAAQRIQAEREASDLENHRERIVWLSAPDPRWSCGTRIDGFTRKVLLKQSLAYVAEAKGAA